MFCLQRLIFEIREVFKFQKICPFAAHFYCTKKKTPEGLLASRWSPIKDELC